MWPCALQAVLDGDDDDDDDSAAATRGKGPRGQQGGKGAAGAKPGAASKGSETKPLHQGWKTALQNFGMRGDQPPQQQQQKVTDGVRLPGKLSKQANATPYVLVFILFAVASSVWCFASF